MGRFLTPPAEEVAAAVKFAWVADVGGQGWGINDNVSIATADGEPIVGGYLFAEAVARLNPDFVLFQGVLLCRFWYPYHVLGFVFCSWQKRIPEILDCFGGGTNYNPS